MTKVDATCDRSLMFGLVFSAAATAVGIKIFNKYREISYGTFSSIPAYWGMRAYWMRSKAGDEKKRQEKLINEISSYFNNNRLDRQVKWKIFSKLKDLGVSAEVFECFRDQYCIVNKSFDDCSNLLISKALWRWKTGRNEAPECVLVYSVQHGPRIYLFKEQPHNISFTVQELENLSLETFDNNLVGKIQFEGKTYWVSNITAWNDTISDDDSDDFFLERWDGTLRKQAIDDWDRHEKIKSCSQRYRESSGPDDLRFGL